VKSNSHVAFTIPSKNIQAYAIVIELFIASSP
jgi:hypothetical protein